MNTHTYTHTHTYIYLHHAYNSFDAEKKENCNSGLGRHSPKEGWVPSHPTYFLGLGVPHFGYGWGHEKDLRWKMDHLYFPLAFQVQGPT